MITPTGIMDHLLWYAIPKKAVDYRLSPDSILSAWTDQGSFLFHRMTGLTCQIEYSVCSIRKNLTVERSKKNPLPEAILVLQRDILLLPEGSSPLRVQESQFNINYMPARNHRQYAASDKDYIHLTIQYPLPLLEEFRIYFPALSPFLEKVHADQPVSLLAENGTITKEIMNTITNILLTRKSPAIHPIYLEYFSRLLLFLLLLQPADKAIRSKFCYREIMKIRLARNLIKEDLSRHQTIPQLSLQAGIGERQLKKGFKELFGMSIHEFRLSERMKKARSLLQRSDRSLSEIARLTGYRNLHRFSKVFTQKFHRAPSEYRKNPNRSANPITTK